MTSLPSPRPNLDFYRKQAKQLMRDVRAGEGRALERIRPQLRHIVSLADAQLVIAREQGFESWASFQESVAQPDAAPRVVPDPALAQLAELLDGDAFGVPRRACEELRAALQRGDGAAAGGAAYVVEWALGKIASGHAVDADHRTRRAEVERVVGDRAVRALEILARVVREEALDAVLRCSFCLKDSHEVAKLIRGSQGYICDACTAAAVEILGRDG